MSNNDSIEISSATVEQAISEALQQLGAAEDDVVIEVLATPRSGLLGLGARDARVRVSRRAEVAATSGVTAPPLRHLLRNVAKHRRPSVRSSLLDAWSNLHRNPKLKLHLRRVLRKRNHPLVSHDPSEKGSAPGHRARNERPHPMRMIFRRIPQWRMSATPIAIPPTLTSRSRKPRSSSRKYSS